MLNGGLAAVSVVAALAILEVGLRLVAPFSTAWSQPNSVLGWSFVPHAHYAFTAPEGCPGWRSAGRINAHGLRDDDHDYTKPPGTFRILALGDSFTEGFQHPLEDTWTKLLEQRLNARHDGRRYEVINAARSGMGTTHEYLYYLTEGYRYAPDLVAVMVIGNDIEDNSKTLSPRTSYGPFFSLASDELVLDASFAHTRSYRLWSMLTPLKQRSLLVSALLRFYSSLRQGPAGAQQCRELPSGAGATAYPAEIEAALAVTRRVLVELGQATKAHAARLVLFNGSREEWDCNQPNMLLAEVSRAADIPYLDLTTPMEDAARQAHALIFGCPENGGGGHWSRAGQAEAAALIGDFLQAQGLVL